MTFIIMILAAGVGLFIYKAYRNTEEAVVNHITPVKDKRTTRASLKVLHLSDLHLEKISVSSGYLYKTLKDEPIDMIALTGDFLDRERTIPKLVPYLNMFSRLKPKYGIYAVFGNHDYVLNEEDFSRLKRTLEQCNCKTLQNEHDRITVSGKPVNIIGIDDYCTERSRIEKAYHGVGEGYHLILTHDPNIVLEMKDHPFDYLLSGHFHGGQVCWPKPYHMRKTMGQLVRMDILKGLHYMHDKPFYINEGLGQSAVNLRVGSRPEITLHTLPLEAAEEQHEVAAI